MYDATLAQGLPTDDLSIQVSLLPASVAKSNRGYRDLFCLNSDGSNSMRSPVLALYGAHRATRLAHRVCVSYTMSGTSVPRKTLTATSFRRFYLPTLATQCPVLTVAVPERHPYDPREPVPYHGRPAGPGTLCFYALLMCSIMLRHPWYSRAVQCYVFSGTEAWHTTTRA